MFASANVTAGRLGQKVFMRWFKHMTDMKDDPKINLVFEEHGHRGVLIYIWLLEIVAKNMDETDLCSLKTTRQHWAKMLRTYWHHVEKILASCRDHGLIFLTSTQDHVDISIPKLLIIRARKKPIGGTKIPLDIEVDIDVDKEPLLFPKGDDLEFQEFWKKYPSRNGVKPNKQKAHKEWLKLKPEEKQKATLSIDAQIEHYNRCKNAMVFVAEFPDAFRWIRDKKFNDEIQKTPLNGSGSTIDPSAEDWSRIIEHIKRYGSQTKMVGLSDRGRAALLKIGGLSTVGQSDSFKLPFLKKDFKDAYLVS